jgi:Tfp pilus assembly protein PilW
MARLRRDRSSGFSLVELLVAVMFIGILMAGMANVFKASVSTLTTTGEGISSARRNRMSMDLLYDDLNSAGLYLTDLVSPPTLSTTNPAFYVLPNMPIAGAAPDDPQTADQLFFYLDQPLPFEGTLAGTGGGAGYAGRSAGQLVMAQAAPVVPTDSTYTVECGDASYAKMVAVGNSFVIKDSFETFYISSVQPPVGSQVTFSVNASRSTAMTGVGPSGAPPKTQHLPNSSVLFYLPAQMVSYSVQMMLYDPQKATGIPCLVRDQGTYSAAGFVPVPALRSIVAENVSGFKVYLSANSGQAWVGLNKGYSGFANGWSAGMRPDLDAQLAAAGRPGYTTTQGDENWIRDIPVLVRLDVTTRTAVKRSEYSATPLVTTAYKDYTQSLVIVPRHFGLTMN